MKQVLIETQLFNPTKGILLEGKSERGNPLVEGILATAEVKNGNGLSLNSGDKVNTKIINKKSYFIDENDSIISLIPENLVNILLNNKNKFELSVSDMVEYEKILIDIVAF